MAATEHGGRWRQEVQELKAIFSYNSKFEASLSNMSLSVESLFPIIYLQIRISEWLLSFTAFHVQVKRSNSGQLDRSTVMLTKH